MNIGIVLCRDRENPVQINFGTKSNVLPFCKSHFFSLFWWRGGCNNFPGQKDGSAVWNIIYF